MLHRIQYDFTAKIWQYDGPNGWYFVTVPATISEEIRTHLKWQEEGWGRLKASAKINELEWKTAIWFDSKQKTYLLPLKSEIRTKCNLLKEQLIAVSIFV